LSSDCCQGTLDSPRANAGGLAASIAAAAVLFSLLFAGPLFDFWLQLTLSALLLTASALFFGGKALRRRLRVSGHEALRALLIGIVSAAVLYVVFYVGNLVSRGLFGFASEQIGSVYTFKEGAGVLRMTLLIALVIGPGEEIFWRGYVQNGLRRYFPRRHWVAAAGVYALVHLASGNFMLIASALVCGLFWGWLFVRFDSLWGNILSHILWDISVFLVFPFAAQG